ncbi:MAG: hypothetical protein QF444_00525 [Phycisphaerales bacterium]|nr:hypothetical protein [Phycisphaerales bacterium]
MNTNFQRLSLMLLLYTAHISFAIELDSIVVQNDLPIAPRGGVMMVRLLSSEQGEDWPTTIPVSFADGSVGEGIVGWIEKSPNAAGWTNENTLIRPILKHDSTQNIHPADTLTGPVLLLPLPVKGDGFIKFGDEYIYPLWRDLPSQFPELSFNQPIQEEKLSITSYDYLPPAGALHYWRWALVASKLGLSPPELPTESDVEKLAAQHGEQIWRIGFQNLFTASRSVAAKCLDLLTDTSTDGGHTFASWVVNPTNLAELLGIITNEQLTSKQLALSALRWADRQPRSLVWFESIFGSSVKIKVSNSRPEPVLFQFAWDGEDNIPLPLEVPSKETGHITLDRPKVTELGVFGPEVTLSVPNLILISPTSSAAFTLEQGVIVARPPRLLMPVLIPSWTLSSLRKGLPNQTLHPEQTLVEVRFVKKKWEVFVRCNGNSQANEAVIEELPPRGVEALTVFVPTISQPLVIQPRAKLNTNLNIDVQTIVLDEGWNAKIVVPDDWIVDGKLSFSIARTHGNNRNIETSPIPVVPWNNSPDPIVIDTTMWNKIGHIPITPEPR